ETYSSVVPAYHMNKEHWVSIIANGSITDDEIYSLVSVSYDLTNVKEPKSRKKVT
ncbi:MAG: MmcQ/YjbR family DNA-binding protein, partial [Clostridia bacterium]|nr:MmcQ/YjbR family DNA-binding protein [Clostridia bacterium]